jgi:PGF-pre-PGF domain-containing protein
MNFFTARNSVSGEEVEILEFADAPSGVPPLQRAVYLYLSITPSVSNDEDIENLLIGFKVELSWASEKGVDVRTIKLYRYNPENGEWKGLPTRLLSDDGRYVYFEATSLKFSIYAIAAEFTGETQFPIPVLIAGVLVAVFGGVAGYLVSRRRVLRHLKARRGSPSLKASPE